VGGNATSRSIVWYREREEREREREGREERERVVEIKRIFFVTCLFVVESSRILLCCLFTI
jgi:hypothetical protein